MRRILSLRLTPSGIRRPSTRFALLLRRSGAVTLSLILSIASLFAVIGAVANAPLPAPAQPPGDSVPVSAENRATQTPSPTATPGALERGDELSPGDSMPEMLESLSGISVGEHVITTTVAFSVAAGSDDAGVDAAGGGCNEGISSWELYVGWCDYGVQPITTGVRFQSVTISEELTLADAYLRVQVEQFSRDVPQTRIYGEAITNSVAFSSNNLPSDRMADITTNYAVWDTATQWEAQQDFYTSPSLLPILEEVTGMAGWESGNAITFLMTPGSDVTVGGSSVYTMTDVHHRFRSWDYADSANEYAPQLLLVYTETRRADPTLSRLVAEPGATEADGVEYNADSWEQFRRKIEFDAKPTRNGHYEAR